MRASIAALLLLLGACLYPPFERDSAARVPQAGSYVYRVEFTRPGAAEPEVYAGRLVLTETTPRLLQGRWEVEGLRGELAGGAWIVAEYQLSAYAGSLAVQHGVTRASAEDPRILDCTAQAAGPGFLVPATCSLTWIGP